MGRSVVIVSGGANGIGRSVVRKLVISGHQVVFSDIDQEAGDALETELGDSNCKFVRADVTSEHDWASVVEATLEAFGCVDALVNNAGRLGPLDNDPVVMENKDMIECVNVHVGGAQLGIKMVLPLFDKEKGGVVINTSSQASSATTATAGIFTARAIAKAGMDVLTRAVVTCHPHIRCYSFNPSFFDTALSRKCIENFVIKSMELKHFEGVCFAQNPLGKVGKVEVLADLYLNVIEGTNWNFNNGASIGVIPNQKKGVYTYVLDQMLGQLSSPSPWAYEPMLKESFQFCDESGTPLGAEAAKELRTLMATHKAQALKTAKMMEEANSRS